MAITSSPFSLFEDDDFILFLPINDINDSLYSGYSGYTKYTKYTKYAQGILSTHNVLSRTTSFNSNSEIQNRTKNLYLPSAGLLMVNKKKPFRVRFKTT
jgi:hypothetical protein